MLHPDPTVLGSRRWARVTNVRTNGFVEFEFTVDDDDLTVELVMPWPALREFLENNRAELLPLTEEQRAAVDAL